MSFTAVCMVSGTALWTLSNIRFNAVMGGLLAVWMFVSFVSAVTLLPVLISYIAAEVHHEGGGAGHTAADDGDRAGRGRGELGGDTR